MNETCACGARFEYDRTGRALPDDRLERVYEMLKEWRQNHRHEMPSIEPGPPYVDTAGALIERDTQYMSTENDIPFGFTRNQS